MSRLAMYFFALLRMSGSMSDSSTMAPRAAAADSDPAGGV